LWVLVMDLVLMALATAVITLTICKAKVLEPLRRWLASSPDPYSLSESAPRTTRGGLLGWLSKLLQCTYCTSHWVAGAVVVVSDHTFHFLRVMAVVALAAPAVWVIFMAHAGISTNEQGETK
jgi:uncharacterized protein DUF1360